MYDIKPQINTLLESIVGEDSVSDAYPDDFNNLPQISFYEADNSDYLKTSDVLNEIIIVIDIWHNRSTGPLAKQVDEQMKSIGFTRTFARDIPDKNVKHKAMRFRGIVNKNDLRIYQ